MPAKRNTPHVLVPLTKGKFAKISPQDAERVCEYGWYVGWSGCDWYAKGSLGYLHRFVIGASSSELVDHINRDTLDCTRENLRIVTPTQSVENRKVRKDNTSGYIGVSWHTNAGKWIAKIQQEGKSIHLGLFADKDEAAKTYDRAAQDIHGSFAELNFP